MLNAQKLLGGLLGGKLGGGKKKMGMGAKATVGLGLLGVAMEAVNHYMNKSQGPPPVPGERKPAPTGSPSATPAAAPPPPPGTPPVQKGAPDHGMAAGPPPQPPAAAQTPPGSPTTEPENQKAILLIRAMIASSNADGIIDDEERSRIMERVEAVGLNAEERTFIEEELRNPKGQDEIVEAVTSPETARQVYAASVIAVDVDTEAERDYLRSIARRLELEGSVADDIHEQLGVPKL